MAHLDRDEASHLYHMLLKYRQDEVEEVSLQVFEGNDTTLPSHWRDEYQFEAVYHVIDRLAHELSETEFQEIAVDGKVPTSRLLEVENELIADEEAMELECYLLHDFFLCFDLNAEEKDDFAHQGLG